MKFINKYRSPNFDKRKKGLKIKHIILHYTGMKSDIEALKYLCSKKNKVSSHFLVNKSGKIYSLVDLKKRAWHAGKSYWKGEIDINSSSVGIEIDNSGKILNFEKYPKKQILALLRLLKYLKQKYQISDSNILGHSDIAPYRKIDPGEKFPWRKLHNYKLIKLPYNFSNEIKSEIELIFKKNKIRSLTNRSMIMLEKIGYDIMEAKKNNKKLKLLIKAYQSRYRSSLVDGKIDELTYKILLNHYIQMLTT